ncbi:2-octaprenyl-3-methyl-6-methoxy-1,4-benzoquinol hydroxylase [Serratia entomophila]|uniref:FAD-dependent 2-octaprenylphenol hydroxylase n=1 Tax=Serratia entomophila TaxID=42906 RepID=UPI001F3A34CD|nr:FAD-dependent 2-octaprenylphenol hydroxylase [Serratia entomophila]UIW17624.1 FAD-dependent 2-octaprenylphenol hydroxylase [Serratia entomophila]CAI0705909.1 2-octaprenyl-3-methyl-6-methoxy-1,4-benzoquinol hydroxylase [Serratia entomophila]CAI0782484.1 2-octaprenyl-3-methyl-6-methoxy-1,4-benzoquinol hydroxylase [Serratia entomophila]CAI0968227.1 2-octaprenyl-3-methyl-6-methoxy-1,4-benzoquinol hydroxylase [Serratia entomophila]CAI0968863.1 2-octaprenyl-3-methyl-6-methoxy-1,4-benzoquinol hydr
MQSFDVVIAGGGMVGLALACGLQGSGLRVAVLERQPPDMTPPQEQPALRVSAINAASERLLQHIGVWEDILQLRASAYNAMEVWDRDSFGKIAFRGDESGFSHLGHIIENAVIQQALWRRAESLSDISLIVPATLKQVAWGENDAFITLEDGRMLTARLVIGADGAQSWLRQHADIPLTFWDYRHHALVATIRTEEPHLATARQVFHGDGILAFLPFGDPHLSSIVWSVAPEEAERLKQLAPEQFNRELAMTFDMRLGNCSLESERQAFPLTGRYARSFAAHRLALVGDAAHTVHPLAGQGANLGFMDAAELIGELRRLQRQGKDIGQHLYLRRYERRRKHGAAVMLAGMQGFRELFDGDNPAKKLLRDVGLRLAGSLPGVKPKLVRQAMGLNDLPEWLA